MTVYSFRVLIQIVQLFITFQKSVGLQVYIISGRRLDVINPVQLYKVVTITFRATQLLDFVHRPLFQKYYRVQEICFRKVDVCLHADERVGRYSFWSVRLADIPIDRLECLCMTGSAECVPLKLCTRGRKHLFSKILFSPLYSLHFGNI